MLLMPVMAGTLACALEGQTEALARIAINGALKYTETGIHPNVISPDRFSPLGCTHFAGTAALFSAIEEPEPELLLP